MEITQFIFIPILVTNMCGTIIARNICPKLLHSLAQTTLLQLFLAVKERVVLPTTPDDLE